VVKEAEQVRVLVANDLLDEREGLGEERGPPVGAVELVQKLVSLEVGCKFPVPDFQEVRIALDG
jgi:hypothetical protein